MKNSIQTFASAIILFGVILSGCSKESDRGRLGADVSQTCYSPNQNLDKAYNSDAKGCSCAIGTADVCKTSQETGLDRYVALSCSDGKWIAVLDGPCAPPLFRDLPPSP